LEECNDNIQQRIRKEISRFTSPADVCRLVNLSSDFRQGSIPPDEPVPAKQAGSCWDYCTTDSGYEAAEIYKWNVSKRLNLYPDSAFIC